jgi:hypothetical protein
MGFNQNLVITEHISEQLTVAVSHHAASGSLALLLDHLLYLENGLWSIC